MEKISSILVTLFLLSSAKAISYHTYESLKDDDDIEKLVKTKTETTIKFLEDTDVTLMYKKSHKNLPYATGLALFSATVSLGVSIEKTKPWLKKQLGRNRIYYLLMAARTYPWQPQDEKSKAILMSAFKILTAQFSNDKFEFDNFVIRLNQYIDMPIANEKLWKKTSYMQNETQLLVYLFKDNGHRFKKHVDKQEELSAQLARI